MKQREWAGRWEGLTVACIASGPSLTAEDCETVREAGLPTIVTNTTFRMCPWADVLFGFDGAWWKEYGGARGKPKDGGPTVNDIFPGLRMTCSALGAALGVDSMHSERWFDPCGTSGTAAISLAVSAGAKRILLLGYDSQKTGGKTHHHGDHPPHLGNAKSMPNWPRRFKNVARLAAGKSEVVNCSRSTALQCFPRGELSQEIARCAGLRL